MIDKTVLELNDRCVAFAVRASNAEAEAEKWRGESALDTARLSEANQTIENLKGEIETLKNDLEVQKDSTVFWYREALKFEAELKALKEAKDEEH